MSAARDYKVGSLVAREGSRNADGSTAAYLVVGYWRGTVKLWHRPTSTTVCASPGELDLVGAASPESIAEARNFQGLERTETLAASFADTDRLLDGAGLTADQRSDLAVAARLDPRRARGARRARRRRPDRRLRGAAVVTAPAPSRRADAFSRIVENHTAEEVDGYLVDVQTAALLQRAYGLLSPASRARFDDVDLERLVDLAWKAAS